MNGLLLTAAFAGGGALLAILAAWVLALCGVDGFHGDRVRRVEPLTEPAHQPQLVRVTSVRQDLAPARQAPPAIAPVQVSGGAA